MGTVLRAAALALMAALGACSTAHYTVNDPLATPRGRDGYAIRHLRAEGNSDSLLVVLAFSGGGYRAAALSYAVMEVLHDTPITWEGQRKPLLDEVDFISAVSGGSLTAAYYALHRERLFDDFVPRVLQADLQSALRDRILSPAGLWRQGSPRYGRSDLLQALLDERVFDGARFADVPHRRPLVFINATDLQFGDRFEFTQDQFDHLCSDLETFPLARAVAASMAVPLLLSPVTLWNHRAHCAQPPERPALASRVHASPYVHLVDGGLADNTGVRAPLEIIGARGGIVGSARAAGFRGVRRRVFIVVNAQLAHGGDAAQSADTPGLLGQLRSVVDVPIDRHGESNIALLHEATRHWQQQLASAPDAELGDTVARDTAFHVIEISLAAARQDPQAEVLAGLGTALRIEPAQWQAVRAFVRRTLARDPQWAALLRVLQAPAAPPPSGGGAVPSSGGSAAPPALPQ